MSRPVEFRVRPLRPYSLSRTAERFALFPEVVDLFDGRVYRRLVFEGRHPLLLHVEQEGAPYRAELGIRLVGRSAATPRARAVAERVVERVLGARVDVRPFYRKFRADPLLGPLIRTFSGLRVAGRLSVWDTLIQNVLLQQINLRFGHSMLCELARAHGRRAWLEGERYFTFPSPKRMASLGASELRRFRLTRTKAATLIRLAEAFQAGVLSEENLAWASDDDVVDRLIAIKGVGRWTAEFTLLRGLARMDVFPAGDLGVVKYLAQDFLGHQRPVSEDAMRHFAEAWRPYRGLALAYVYAELARRRRAAPEKGSALR